MATGADGDQPAVSAAEVAEPAIASTTEPTEAQEVAADKHQEKKSAKPADSKAKATPAKPKASNVQQPGERTSGRRERKQTSFFQPEKKVETEKLEIKEVSIAILLIWLIWL